jgi:hypothetical protein
MRQNAFTDSGYIPRFERARRCVNSAPSAREGSRNGPYQGILRELNSSKFQLPTCVYALPHPQREAPLQNILNLARQMRTHVCGGPARGTPRSTQGLISRRATASKLAFLGPGTSLQLESNFDAEAWDGQSKACLGVSVAGGERNPATCPTLIGPKFDAAD